MLLSRRFTLLAPLLLVMVTAFHPARADSPLRIGQTIAQTGPTAEHGLEVFRGARVYLDEVNARGGIHGRRIELITLDDGGQARQAAENTRALIEQHQVLAIFGGIEGGPCTASMAVAESAQVPLIACMAGTHAFRREYQRHVFPLRAGHLSEFEKLIDNARMYGLQRIAFLHADSANGREHLANVNQLLSARGMPPAIALSIPATNDAQTIAGLVSRLETEQVQAMFNHGSYAFYAELIHAARKRNSKTLFMAVNSGAQQMVKHLGADAEGLIFTQVVPYPWGSTAPVAHDYRQAFSRAYPQAPYSFSSLEGYLSARLLVEALRRAGPGADRVQIVQALESLGHADLGGFPVHYSPRQHDGADFVDTVIALRDGSFRH